MRLRHSFAMLAIGLSGLAQAAIDPQYQYLNALPAAQDTLVLPLRSSDLKSGSHSLLADPQLKQQLTAAGFTGKAGSISQLYSVAGYQRVLLLGLGDKPVISDDKLASYGADLAAALDKNNAQQVTIDGRYLAAIPQLVHGLELRAYRFDQLKSKAEAPRKLAVDVVVADVKSAEQQHQQLQAIADGVYLARDLTNLPAADLTPQTFAEAAQALEKLGVKVTVLDEKAINALGMGALAAVGRGSDRPPTLVIAHWQGDNKAPLALIGKGITFDTGGYNLKTDGESIVRMTSDMAGAAAVLGTVKALALQKAKVNVVGVMAMAENMISSNAYLPGDVLKTAQGLTIQITSTDAEGRLVMADAMWYARKEYKPRAMVDIATLTGSKVGALGNYYAGLFTEDEALNSSLQQAAKNSGEPLWRLPLSDEFASELKSDVADLRNTGKTTGASTAAWFLKQFAGDTPWAHLDIAGNALASSDKGVNPVGATGFGVRLLTHWTLQQP
ncbi:leucyl aminopeptidase [Rheinheimera sp.]|uniref:leucyl aminopeptidase n=1 Tax=Rheinheimera sp. TaxID=1869214 RepID=UPI003D2D4461